MSPDASTSFDLTPGKVIADRYRIVRPCRRNDFALIFEATAVDSEESRELMVFPWTLFETEDQRDEFLAAWEPWKTIDSPHVAHVVDLVQIPGHLVLVSSFPPGGTLRGMLDERGRLDQISVRGVGLQMLRGVCAIHESELVHGDIKPGTVHISGGGEGEWGTMLVDGGVTPALWRAKHLGDRTALIGTPFYAPVEQFGGESPDMLSDIYNVSTVLFELVTGVIPWAGNNFLEVFQAKLEKSAPSMSARAPDAEVNPELERVIVTGLLADKKERFSAAGDFLRALEELKLDAQS